MKMLMYDFRESEKDFFKTNTLSDFEIIFRTEPLNIETKIEETLANSIDILCIYRNSKLTKDVLKKFKNLRIIATKSYDFSNIDIEYCKNHNITVLNVELYNAEGVAELTFGLIITLTRNLLPAIYGLKNDHIKYEAYEGKTLSNLTLGIIGCGEVGKKVAEFANYFGMEILINSYMHNNKIDKFCKFVSLEDLMRKADIVTILTPYNGDNYQLIGEQELDIVKQGCYIINTSRGELLDINALYKNIVNKKIKGAAIDTFECENLCTQKEEICYKLDKYNKKDIEKALIIQKLQKLDNVIITQHLAYNTEEAVYYILQKTFNNIRDFLKGNKSNRVC